MMASERKTDSSSSSMRRRQTIPGVSKSLWKVNAAVGSSTSSCTCTPPICNTIKQQQRQRPRSILRTTKSKSRRLSSSSRHLMESGDAIDSISCGSNNSDNDCDDTTTTTTAFNSSLSSITSSLPTLSDASQSNHIMSNDSNHSSIRFDLDNVKVREYTPTTLSHKEKGKVWFTKEELKRMELSAARKIYRHAQKVGEDVCAIKVFYTHPTMQLDAVKDPPKWKRVVKNMLF